MAKVLFLKELYYEEKIYLSIKQPNVLKLPKKELPFEMQMQHMHCNTEFI